MKALGMACEPEACCLGSERDVRAASAMLGQQVSSSGKKHTV